MSSDTLQEFSFVYGCCQPCCFYILWIECVFVYEGVFQFDEWQQVIGYDPSNSLMGHLLLTPHPHSFLNNNDATL